MATDAYIALGSNIGDRFRHLQAAVIALNDHPDIAVKKVSPVYESAAHTLTRGEQQPEFLNAVARVATELSPLRLLEVCLEIERRAGRRRSIQWAPRTIDLDLVAYNAEQVDLPNLRIPHPRLAERRFVLQPLADIAPDLWLPSPHNQTVYFLLERTPDEGPLRRLPQELCTSP